MRISDWSSDVCSSDPFEETLGVECSHAAGPGRGHRLPVDLVLHVAAGEHARNARARASGLHLDIALAVEIELALKQAGRRRMTDGDECAFGREVRGFPSLYVTQFQAGEARSEEHTSELPSLMRNSY